ncbi:MAG: hypothetical protein K2Y18_02645 [Alphaproteobacteria bacterium]|jgi:hypothetical protein|nr:hypothetical protein [Alphaproteobacteria bacterium]
MINAILSKINQLVFMGLFLVSSVIAMDQVEKKVITPQNSTVVYYKLANEACTLLLQEYAAKGGDEIVPGFAHETVTAQNAITRVKTAFRTNILGCGLHPGIPEKLWSEKPYSGLRGTIKFGNHRLILKVRELYEQYYVLNDGVKLRDIVNNFDYIEHPYIDYSKGFSPKMPGEMNEGERAYVQGLIEAYDQANPNQQTPDCVVM